MKKLVTAAAILFAATTGQAQFFDDGNGYGYGDSRLNSYGSGDWYGDGRGYGRGYGRGRGTGSGDGEMDFSMKFKGRARADMDADMDADTDWYGSGYGNGAGNYYGDGYGNSNFYSNSYEDYNRYNGYGSNPYWGWGYYAPQNAPVTSQPVAPAQ
jgi:hypothetical protein